MKDIKHIKVQEIDWDLHVSHKSKLNKFLNQCGVYTISDLRSFCVTGKIFKTHKYTSYNCDQTNSQSVDWHFGKRYRYEIQRCLKFFYPNENFDLSLEYPKPKLISYKEGTYETSSNTTNH